MNSPQLQALIDLIRQSGEISDAEKSKAIANAQEADDELRTKSRDLEIEASLEKVRAVALGMKEAEDLLAICEVLFHELQNLGFPELRNALINIYTDDAGDFVNFDYSDALGKSMNHINVKHQPILIKHVQKIRSAKDAFVETIFKDEDLEDWKKFRKKSGEPDDPRLDKTSALYYYFYSVGDAAIGISSFVIITNDEREILKRFRNVFDLAYKIYTDVSRAKSQARKAQIELALERVRARTMSMQNSNELQEAAMLLFDQVKALGIETGSCGYNIWEKDRASTRAWMSSPDGGMQAPFILDHTEVPLYKRVMLAKLKGDNYFSEKLAGDELAKHFEYLLKVPILGETIQGYLDKGIKLPEVIYYHIVFFKQGYLSFHSHQDYPEAQELFKRFAIVFEQTYTRFLDLVNAEKQAHEAKIEASLERVRGRAMAMHNSEDLSETINVFFRELKALGVVPIRCGVGKVDDETHTTALTLTTASQQGDSFQVVGKLKQAGHPVLSGIYDNWKTQTEYHPVLQGEDLKAYYKVANAQIGFPDYDENVTQYGNMFYFKEGFVYAWTAKELSDDELKVFRRFTSVLSLTYRRFEDLREAELQTHKAKIEVALERVRARALAMQEPEELLEVSKVLRHEMGKLGVKEIETSSIYIFDESADETQYWYALKDHEQSEKDLLCEQVILDLNKTEIGREMIAFYKSDEKELNIPVKENVKSEWLKYCDVKSIPTSDIEDIANGDLNYHLQKFSNGAIGAVSGALLPDETRDILRRAASVFSLAYKRYLDLTKARFDLVQLKEEKKRSDSLLLNILPADIAEELKAFGKSYARKHENVSILFADIKGFSTIAETMSADALVTQLDECFRAFDNIVEKHGLEKIKTVGDAYVCACGLPKPVNDNAIKTVKAALDMLDFLKGFGTSKKVQNLPAFEFRIGIHTGSVVTGVVGLKKFTYDIWGDAVNLAARMEQNGEAGKINVSGTTYELIKDKFTCTHRGKIAAKNKGEIDMYFVEVVA